MAEFSAANYLLNKKGMSRDDRFGAANDSLPDGYGTHDSSSKDVALFLNPETHHAVISHRGTNLGQAKDIVADLAFIMGKENHNQQFQARTRKTERLINEIPDDYTITLQGHSYGGASALNSAVKNHKIRHAIDEINLYNPLTFGDHENQKIHTSSGERVASAEDELHGLTTTYRTKNDIVSSPTTQFGNTKNFKAKANKYKSIPKPFKHVFRNIDLLNAHGLHNFMN